MAIDPGPLASSTPQKMLGADDLSMCFITESMACCRSQPIDGSGVGRINQTQRIKAAANQVLWMEPTPLAGSPL
jgi:hypothetical protein